MGRMFVAQFSGSAETATTGLIELNNGSDRVSIIHEWSLSQGTELGDAEEEMLLLRVEKGVTPGTAGASTTPVPLDAGDAASASTFEYSQGTSSGGNILQSIYWNIRVPIQQIYTPETRPVLGPSEVFVVELASAPTDSVTIGGYLIWEEIGT